MTNSAPLLSAYAYYVIDAHSAAHNVLNEADFTADHVLTGFTSLQDRTKELGMNVAIKWDEDTPQIALSSKFSREEFVAKNRSLTEIVTLSNAWNNVAEELCALEAFHPIEEKIIAEATANHEPIICSPSIATVALGTNISLRARPYKVFAEWVYQSPIHPLTQKRFAPPKAREITEKELKAMTFDTPLHNFRCQHARLRHFLKTLPVADPR